MTGILSEGRELNGRLDRRSPRDPRPVPAGAKGGTRLRSSSVARNSSVSSDPPAVGFSGAGFGTGGDPLPVPARHEGFEGSTGTARVRVEAEREGVAGAAAAAAGAGAGAEAVGAEGAGTGGGESMSMAFGLGAAASADLREFLLTPAPPSSLDASSVTVARRGVLEAADVADLLRGDRARRTGDGCVARGMKFCGPNDSVHSLGSNFRLGDSGACAGVGGFAGPAAASGQRFLVGEAEPLRLRWPLDLVLRTGGASDVSEPAVKVKAEGAASEVNQGPEDSVAFFSKPKLGRLTSGFTLSLRLPVENLYVVLGMYPCRVEPPAASPRASLAYLQRRLEGCSC